MGNSNTTPNDNIQLNSVVDKHNSGCLSLQEGSEISELDLNQFISINKIQNDTQNDTQNWSQNGSQNESQNGLQNENGFPQENKIDVYDFSLNLFRISTDKEKTKLLNMFSQNYAKRGFEIGDINIIHKELVLQTIATELFAEFGATILEYFEDNLLVMYNFIGYLIRDSFEERYGTNTNVITACIDNSLTAKYKTSFDIFYKELHKFPLKVLNELTNQILELGAIVPTKNVQSMSLAEFENMYRNNFVCYKLKSIMAVIRITDIERLTINVELMEKLDVQQKTIYLIWMVDCMASIDINDYVTICDHIDVCLRYIKITNSEINNGMIEDYLEKSLRTLINNLEKYNSKCVSPEYFKYLLKLISNYYPILHNKSVAESLINIWANEITNSHQKQDENVLQILVILKKNAKNLVALYNTNKLCFYFLWSHPKRPNLSDVLITIVRESETALLSIICDDPKIFSCFAKNQNNYGNTNILRKIIKLAEYNTSMKNRLIRLFGITA